MPPGLEFNFSNTTINGAAVHSQQALIIPAADDPAIDETGATQLYVYDGPDATYSTSSTEFDGGTGLDTVIYYGSRADFSVELNGKNHCHAHL